VGPQTPHAGHVVLQLRELDLELALGRVGVVGEDAEDHGGAVDDGDAELLLEVALLARRQLVVAGDDVGVQRLDALLDLRQLALADVGVGVRRLAVLDLLAHDRDAGGAQQLLQLGQVVALGQRGDHQRTLTRTTRGRAVAGGRLGRTAVPAAFHLPSV
jgi:hypothetical protein